MKNIITLTKELNKIRKEIKKLGHDKENPLSKDLKSIAKKLKILIGVK